MALVLRTGSAEDAGACAQVWERSVRARDGAAPADLAHVRGRLRSGHGRLRLGAEQDDGRDLDAPDAVLGFSFAVRAGDDVLLTHLAVLPAAQRRGIALRLMADAIESARSASAPRLLLEVRAGNDAALALYAGLGFRALRGAAPHPLGGQPLQLLGLDLR